MQIEHEIRLLQRLPALLIYIAMLIISLAFGKSEILSLKWVRA